MRADAERSMARILEAAEAVLADDPNASLERVADAAGLARATVHRRFASRGALVDALTVQLNERYRQGLRQARVDTAPPLLALHRLTETVFELKVSHRFAMNAAADPVTQCPRLSPEVVEGLELLFARLRTAGVITAAGPSFCCRVFLALLHEVARLPDDAPDLAQGGDPTGARIDLLVRTVIGALGGDGQALTTLRP
jgi:AcrR family transcriptional regulator